MDPLKFAVAIQDEATKQLENIQKEFDKLKDQTINVKVSGLDELRQLLSALQHQQVNNLGNEVSMGLKAAAEGLQKEAQEAVRSSLGKLAEELALVKTAIQHDNFTAFSGRIQKCAEAVDALDAAFKKFHVTIGQDEGMRNFMVGLGEVIRNVRSTMGTLEVGKNGGISAIANNYERNVQRIEDAMRRIRETHLILGDKLGNAKSAGVGIDNRYIYMLDAYQRKLEQIRRDEEVMHGKGWNADNAYKDLLRNASSYIKYLDSQIQKQKTIETNQRRYNTALEEMQKLLARLDAASSKGYGLSVDTLKTNMALQDVQKFIDKLLLVNNKNFGDSHFINELIAEYTRLKSTLSSVAREQENLNKTTEKTNKKDADKSARDARKENDAWAESMRRAGVEATKLEIQIRKLHEAEARGKLAKIDVTNLSARIAELQNFANILRSIESGSRSYGHASEVVNSVPYQNAIRLAQEESAAVRKAASEKERAAHSAQQLTVEEQRLAQAMNQSTQSARNQSQVLSDLRGMMTQYLSVYGAQQFLTEMANITGELELQKKSLEVIIGSAQTAGALFGEIRDLSQMSPYTFQDLLKSTRQLAAFGIETKDLYGTMRALSDIGAGLNVDVQRLILAYGHVRSYGYLSGIQNRQFETAGVDMVGALTDRYNRLADAEERAGRAAEHVTRKDIFKKISKREVSFEDVNSVIMDLDKPGGRFYNMQERQFDTLGGKLRNLRNNYNIMMAEMGESNKGLLMGSVNMLNELTAHWDKYARLITSILVPIGAYKLATLALNGALGMQANTMARNVVAMGQSAKAMEALNAVQLRGGFSSYLRAFTGGWKSQSGVVTRQDSLAFRNVLGKGLENGSLTKAQLRMMSLSSELPTRLRTVAGAMSGLTGAELKAAAGATGLNRQFMLMKLRLATAGASLRAFGASMLSMMFGPQAAVMAIIAGITALYSHFSSMAEDTRQALDNMADAAKNDSKEILNILNKYKGNGVNLNTSLSYMNGKEIMRNAITFDDEELKRMNIATELEELKRQLQSMSPFYEGDLIDIEKMGEQLEQFKAIIKLMESYRYANDLTEATRNAYEGAAGGSFWSGYEGFIENMDDFSESIRDIEEEVRKLSEEEIANLDKDLGGALTEMVNSNVAGDAADALRMTIVNTLMMSSEDRQKVWKSWSDGMKRVYLDVTGANGWGKGAEVRHKDMQANISRIANAAIPYLASSDLDMDGQLKYLSNIFESFAAQVKDLQEKERMFGELVRSTLGDEGYNAYIQKAFKSDFNKAMSGRLTGDETEKEVSEKAKTVIDEVRKSWIKAGKEIKLVTQETFDEIANASKSMTPVQKQWQRELQGAMENAGKTSYSAFYNAFKKEIQNSETLSEFFSEEMKKKHDELSKKISGAFPELRKVWNINIEPDFKVDTKNLDKLKEIRDSISRKLGEIALNNGSNSNEYRRAKETFDEVKKDLDAEILLLETAQEYGYTYGDKNNKTKGTGTFKDKEAEVWEQRIKLIQEARREYEYWEKKIGKDAAQEKVKEKFSTLVGVDEILKPGDLDDLEHYEKALRRIQDEVKARYEQDKKLAKGQTKDTKIANDIKELRELANAIDAIEKAQFERASEQFVSKMSAAVEELTEKWERYNIVRKATGDIGLAASLAGVNTSGNAESTSANDVKNMLQEQLRNIGGEALVASIPLDVHLDEESLKEKLQASVPEAYKNEIEGLVKVYQEWQKLQKQVVKDDLQIFSDLLSSAVDLQSEVVKINNAYDEQMKSIERLREKDKDGKHSAEYTRAENIAKANRDMGLIQATKEYKMLVDGVTTMSKDAAEKVKRDYCDALKRQFDAGSISAKQYAEKIADITKKMSDLNFAKGDTRAYFEGGLDGLFQNKIDTGQSLMEQGALEGNDAMQQMGKGMLNFGNTGMSVVSIIDTIVHGIDGIVQGLNDTFNEIRDMYEALGYDTDTDDWEDANAFFSSFSKASSNATSAWDSLKSGNVGGVISGVVGSVTSWITGFAQAHDKKRQNHIDKMQEQVDALEANTEALKMFRERTLGYDNGALGLRNYYKNLYAGNDDVSNAMRTFYRGASTSGYADELRNLEEERILYMRMYNEEADKKDESEEALLEYKEKISELDDQIRFFAEDLAKELWDIDFESWADQFTDALASAFENGENLMDSFNDTAKSIMQSVVNEMMKVGIIEPMIEKLRQQIFGYTDSNGVYHSGVVTTDELVSNPSSASKKVLTTISNWFKPGGAGNSMVLAAKEYMTGIDSLLQQLGFDNGLKNSESSNTLSASVQGVTEETADLLAGYVNALRQDVAENRLLLTQFVAQFWPDYEEAFMAQVGAVNRIDSNVQAMMEMMRYGSGALYDEIRSLRARIDNVVDGAESFAMR